MLQLTKIHIKNFRSFRDVSFELKDIQLLIGPNNSGKTNLLRVFEFLNVAHDFNEAKKIDLTKIRYQHKEFHGRSQRLPDPIEITLELFESNVRSFFYYKIELFNLDQDIFNQFLGVSNKQLSVQEFLNLNLQISDENKITFTESLLLRNGTMKASEDSFISFLPPDLSNSVNYLVHTKGVDGTISRSGNKTDFGSFFYGYYGFTDLNNQIQELRSFFQKLIIYKPDTFFIKQPITNFQADKSINGNCDNIASYLENLQSSDPDKFQQINNELSKSLSDFKGYNFDTVTEYQGQKGKEVVRYFRLKDKFGINHLAEDISEGALYFLMLIAIINQKDIPPILMLEEPETGIHPRRISEIMEYLFVLRDQHPEISIILTTHHPYVVDHFSEMTDRVWIFDNENGETSIKNLQHDVIEPSNDKIKAADMEPIDYTSSLGEHWALGFLGGVPKAVVRG